MDSEHPPMVPRRGAQEGAKLPQYLVTLAACMIVFCGGTALGWTSPAIPVLLSPNSTLTLNKEQVSWVGSILTVGALAGAFPAGAVAEIYGRKWTVFSLGFPMVIAWVMTTFSINVGLLYTARFIAGLALGAMCAVVPMYVGEIAEDSVRGTLSSYFQIMLVGGILYSYIVGTVFSYKVFCMLCGVLPVVFLIVFFKAPETPIFLIKKNRKIDAEKALRDLRGNNYNIFKELNALQNAVDKESNANISLINALKKKASVKAIIISSGLMVFQQFSGINIVVIYSSFIFIQAGSTLDPNICTIIVGFAQLAATLVSLVLVDRAGRKILLLISAIVMAICHGALGKYFHMEEQGTDVSSLSLIPLSAVVVYMIVFALGFGPVPWIMCGEVLPSEIKGFGTGLAVAVNWMLAFIMTKTFPDLLNLLGAGKTYWLFGIICCISFIFVASVVIETKGKSLLQIQDELSGNKRPQPKPRSSIHPI